MTQFISLDRTWNFRRLPLVGTGVGDGWSRVDLPHCPFTPDLDGRTHWFGECEYQRTIMIPADAPQGRCALWIGAAMHTAVVLVDGVVCGRHEGGYLPFEVDLPAIVRDGRPHQLLLLLDNRDNADIPPGKPYADLDFCWYGGLYRGAELRFYPGLHITDPVAANEIAGGGVFVRTLEAAAEAATVSVQTHLRNVSAEMQEVTLEVEIRLGDFIVVRGRRDRVIVDSDNAQQEELVLSVPRPKLWQPDSPVLHHAHVTVRGLDGAVIDERVVRFGIRCLAFSRSGGLQINGRRFRLRGTNRHQEYPFVGYAVPAAAQRRDARRLKEAGFDYVRLSHYPQSPDFLAACDELGILVMNCLPGWQFINGERFREACFRNAREMIRRDRNHPCVVLWELSLNETSMDDAFMRRLHAIGHEEFPGDQMFTCGWIDCYDVFIHSRQHGELHRWVNGDKALVVAEYGDWEFYASNHGFDQKTGAGVYAAWSNARQRRGNGERGLRQQAWNHFTALNDVLGSPAVLDGQWAMFDYARGYDPERAACGVMDVFRLPKFSYYFYRSQRHPAEHGDGWAGGPMVYIASHWTPASDLRVLIFGNCEEVELRLNGALVGRHQPARAWMTQYLPHPPFVFDLPAFVPGVLEAVGYSAGRAAASHRVATPGAPARLELVFDTVDISAGPGEPDVIIAHAQLLDGTGTLCVEEQMPVLFSLEGSAELAGPTLVVTEAGVASTVLRIPADCIEVVLNAEIVNHPRPLSSSGRWRRNGLRTELQRAGPAVPLNV